MAEAGEFTNMGMRLNDVWYLQITKTDEIPCLRLSCNNNKEAKAKGKSQIIAKIEKLDGIYETYCLTEPKKILAYLTMFSLCNATLLTSMLAQ